MKNLLILLAIPMLFISCVRDNDEDNNTGETVNLDLDLSLSFTLEKTGEANKGAGITNKFSEFNHIFKDEVDLVFTSTTTDFTTTLTITPNDLSNTPTLVIPYWTYSWSIDKETFDYENDDYFKSYLSIFGSGQVEIYSSEVSLNLIVDTNYSLVTVEKENVTSAKLILDTPLENDLVLRGNYYYLYAFSFPEEYSSILQNRGYILEVEESVYNTSISVNVGENQTFYPKTHYNYILAFSDLDVNSITLKTAAFEQIDYYLQPTGTASSTCSLSLSPYQSQSYLTQTVSVTSSIQTVTFSTSTTCSETINYSVSGLPDGVSMDIIELTYPRISGTVSSSVSSGTYNYTITAFNSTSSSTATVSATATGTIIVTNTNSETTAGIGVGDDEFEVTTFISNIGTDYQMTYSNGYLYTQSDNSTIKKISVATKSSTIIATSFVNGCSGNGYSGLECRLTSDAIAVDNDGNVYVHPLDVNLNPSQSLLKKITPDGVVSILAGGDQGFADGSGTSAKFQWSVCMIIGPDGNIYSTDSGRIRKITPSGEVSTYLEDTNNESFRSIVFDSNGNLFISTYSTSRILKLTTDGVLSVFAGGSDGYKDGNGTNAMFYKPSKMVIDSNDNLYVADSYCRIRKITPSAYVTTIAGPIKQKDNGMSECDYIDDFGNDARFSWSSSVSVSLAIDSSDNLYIGERDNSRIRKISL